MMEKIEKYHTALLLFGIIFFSVFFVSNPAVLMAADLEAPTSTAGPIINYAEELAGFDVRVNLVGSGAVVGDEIELYYDEGTVFDPPLIATVTNDIISDGQYVFTVGHGQFTNDGQIIIAFVIRHEGVESPESPYLNLTIDTTAPNIEISTPVSGDLANAQTVIVFSSDDFAAQCGFDNNNWQPCQSGTTTLGDLSEFGNLADGLFSFYVKAGDDNGNIQVASSSGIIKDTTRPVGTVTSTNDGFITDELIFDIQVTYNEAMDTGTGTIISFGTTTGIFSAQGPGAWSEVDGVDIWTQAFRITDGNESLQNVTVNSSGAIDLVGNLEAGSAPGSIDIDTENPQAVITISHNQIHEGNLIQTVTLVYGEPMDTESNPIVYFDESSHWSNQGGSWSDDDTTYVAIFTHDGTREEVDNEFVYVDPSTAIADMNGNDELSASSSVFEIDTVHPNGYSVSIDQSEINRSNQTGLSFSYTGAEVGTIYNYTINDNDNGTGAVSGSGVIAATSGNVSGINVSDLRNGTLTLVFYLINEFSDRGEDVSSTVNKRMSSSPIPIYSGIKEVSVNAGVGKDDGKISNDAEKIIKIDGGMVLGVKIINNGKYFPGVELKKGSSISKNTREVFAKIYKRIANEKDKKDLIALNFISFNLKVNNRNLNTERRAIGIFGRVFGRLPSSSSDWNINRAIAYSEIKI